MNIRPPKHPEQDFGDACEPLQGHTKHMWSLHLCELNVDVADPLKKMQIQPHTKLGWRNSHVFV